MASGSDIRDRFGDLLTVRDVAALFKRTEGWVREAYRNRHLPGFQVVKGGDIFFPEKAVVALIDARLQGDGRGEALRISEDCRGAIRERDQVAAMSPADLILSKAFGDSRSA